jgi:trk system potassium uptake protein TrkH
MSRRALSPAQLLAVSFGALILLGTGLLGLPLVTESGTRVPLVDAFFTATSAVCVTGLIVVDTPVVWSTPGEIVVMLLIQMGGLGYMTLSTSLGFLLGRKLSLHEQATLQESLNVDTREGLGRFAFTVLRTTLLIELTATVVLGLWWWPRFGAGQGFYLALFHSVSAFNNAGFSLFRDNLMAFRGDLVVNIVITTLIVLGGLGFFALKEVAVQRRPKRFTMHTRLVLAVTGLLIVGGALCLLILEWSNPATLGPLPFGEKVLAAYFQAISPRTAGFNTIEIGGMTVPALFLTMALMFIGAAPGGTGGGVKVSTLALTVLALWATVRGEREPVVFGRRIASETVARAFFICLIAFLALNIVAALILVAERRDLLPTLFETTSAFGTVGLSMGQKGSVLSLAGHMSSVGKLLLVAMMFMGRVGPLTLAIALAARRERARVRYPEGRVLIG